MNAGRALDKLIAEKVMEWSVSRVDEDYIDRNGHFTGWTTGLVYSKRKLWRPSTEIAAAWAMVEHLSMLGIHLWAVGQEDAAPGWQADFGRNHSSDQQGWGTTAQLALCLAALKAVGHGC